MGDLRAIAIAPVFKRKIDARGRIVTAQSMVRGFLITEASPAAWLRPSILTKSILSVDEIGHLDEEWVM